MNGYFLWGGLTLYVALPSIMVFSGLSLAGLLMIIGFVLMVLKK